MSINITTSPATTPEEQHYMEVNQANDRAWEKLFQKERQGRNHQEDMAQRLAFDPTVRKDIDWSTPKNTAILAMMWRVENLVGCRYPNLREFKSTCLPVKDEDMAVVLVAKMYHDFRPTLSAEEALDEAVGAFERGEWAIAGDGQSEFLLLYMEGLQEFQATAIDLTGRN